MRRLIQTIGAFAALLAAGPVLAALFDRGGGMIYDNVFKITWLSDWNYAGTQYETSGGTQGYADGRMDWVTANDWANNLVYGGFDDWRLPILVQPDTTCNGVYYPTDGSDMVYGGDYYCTGSAMGNMFYNYWGATAGFPPSSGTNLENLALFKNVLSGIYWFGPEYTPDPTYEAWAFDTFEGWQGPGATASVALYAVAVRLGDVVAAVPEPQTAALVLLALGLTAVVRRKAN